MANFQVRHNITYQVDYLDLKDLKKDREKIIKDLKNIVFLNSQTDSSHLSIMFDPKNINTELLWSLLGVPFNTWMNGYSIGNIKEPPDTTGLSKSITDSLKYVRTDKTTGKHTKRPTPVVYFKTTGPISKEASNTASEKVIGVVFIHTLLYSSEIGLLLKHFEDINFPTNCSSYPELDKQFKINQGKTFVNSIAECAVSPSYSSFVTVLSEENVPEIKEGEEYDLKAFTIMIPIYEYMNFVEPNDMIFSKKSLFKEHSILNWFVDYRYLRYRSHSIDPFITTDVVPQVIINFTYFPSVLNEEYYNKYVGEMTSTSNHSFMSSKFLKSSFTFFEGKEAKNKWKELTKDFNFYVLTENLICSMNINNISGIFGRNSPINNIDSSNYEHNVISSIPSVILLFMYGSELQSSLLKGINWNIPSIDSIKEFIEKLEESVKKLNSICPNIIYKGTIKHILYHLYIYFITLLIEHNGSSVNKRQIQMLKVGKTNGLKVNVGTFFQRWPIDLSNTIVGLVNTNSNEKLLSIIRKSTSMYFEKIIDMTVSFIRLNKDIKSIVEEHNIIKANEYFHGGFGDTFYMKWNKYCVNLIRNRFSGYTPSKKPPEYRILNLLLSAYKIHAFANYKISEDFFTKEEGYARTPMGFFKTAKHFDILKEGLTFDKYVERITTILETFFPFIRII